MKFLYDKMSDKWKIKYHQQSVKHLRAQQNMATTDEEKEKLEKVIEKHYEIREKLLK